MVQRGHFSLKTNPGTGLILRLMPFGTVEDWATESLVAARMAYQVPETKQRLKPGQKLSDAYFNANLPVARQRLYQAGVRLAKVLNEAFPDL
jgi:hypothetical protein